MQLRTQSGREALDEEAARLVVQVHCSGDEAARAAAMQWVSADPANAVAYARAEAAWEAAARLRTYSQSLPAASNPPEAAAVESDTVQEAPAPAGRFGRRSVMAALVAASGLAFAFPGVRRSLFGEQIVTEVGERRDVVLADGSVLRLNTATRVEVTLLKRMRFIRLMSGEASFEVAHDPSRPFYVEAAHSRIRAVGTAFNVRIRQEMVELTVTDGVVAVAAPGDDRVLDQQPHITAGEGAAIRRGTVAATSLDPEAFRQRTAWHEGMIELDGNTLEQAVAEFNRYRSAPLVIGDARIATMRIGGRFGTSDSERFIAALQQTLPIRAITGPDNSIMLVQAD